MEVTGDQWLSRLLPWCCCPPPHGTIRLDDPTPVLSHQVQMTRLVIPGFFGSPAQGVESFFLFSLSLSLQSAYCPQYAASSCGGTLAKASSSFILYIAHHPSRTPVLYVLVAITSVSITNAYHFNKPFVFFIRILTLNLRQSIL